MDGFKRASVELKRGFSPFEGLRCKPTGFVRVEARNGGRGGALYLLASSLGSTFAFSEKLHFTFIRILAD